MAILVNCPDCGHGYRVGEERAGTRIWCKECGGPIPVPGRKRRRERQQRFADADDDPDWEPPGEGAPPRRSPAGRNARSGGRRSPGLSAVERLRRKRPAVYEQFQKESVALIAFWIAMGVLTIGLPLLVWMSEDVPNDHQRRVLEGAYWFGGFLIAFGLLLLLRQLWVYYLSGVGGGIFALLFLGWTVANEQWLMLLVVVGMVKVVTQSMRVAKYVESV
ncbi:MAG: hypothetical protein KY476_04740 [Planctomycetes bacterium]|nr:hypothetical protein [Planctomycetota bacterium]